MIAAQCHYVFVLVCIFAADAIAQTPRPAANPRQNVFGVYSVRQRVGAGDMSARCVKEGDCIAALLLVGENDVGWFVQSDGSGEPLGQIPFPAWPVCNFSANNAGQLLLDVCGGGEGAYDGFQTDEEGDSFVYRRSAVHRHSRRPSSTPAVESNGPLLGVRENDILLRKP